MGAAPRGGRPADQGPALPRADGAVSATAPATCPACRQTSCASSEWFSSFTRVDANLSPRNTLVATGRRVSERLALGDARHVHAAGRDRRSAAHAATRPAVTRARRRGPTRSFGETTVQVHDYRNRRRSRRAPAPMQLLPETTLGNFFNQQHRDTRTTYQVIESMSGIARGAWRRPPVQGRHRPAAQRVRRREPEPAGAHRAHRRHARPAARLRRRADHAVDRQHRRGAVRAGSFPAEHALVGRVRRPHRSRRHHRSFQPHAARRRGGAVERLGQRGAARRFRPVLRAHAVDRRHLQSSSRARSTPVMRADGATPLGPPLQFTRVTDDLDTPRSRTWDISYDHRFNRNWSLHVGGDSARRQPRAASSNPAQTGAATGELRLSSTGRSTYREADIGVHFTHGPLADFNVTYARSSARGDLNTLTQLLRHDDVAGGRPQRLRAGLHRRAAPAARARPRDADAAVAPARHPRLAQRPAVFGA